MCGGSIISENIVLTVGHCFFTNYLDNAIDVDKFRVEAGTNNIGVDKGIIKNIESIYLPKNFPKNVFHDVAVIKVIFSIFSLVVTIRS